MRSVVRRHSAQDGPVQILQAPQGFVARNDQFDLRLIALLADPCGWLWLWLWLGWQVKSLFSGDHRGSWSNPVLGQLQYVSLPIVQQIYLFTHTPTT